jgi:hypothetical protein
MLGYKGPWFLVSSDRPALYSQLIHKFFYVPWPGSNPLTDPFRIVSQACWPLDQQARMMDDDLSEMSFYIGFIHNFHLTQSTYGRCIYSPYFFLQLHDLLHVYNDWNRLVNPSSFFASIRIYALFLHTSSVLLQRPQFWSASMFTDYYSIQQTHISSS